MTVAEFAAAKVNLTLHVTGQRSDGYHLLDSLVCFAATGDTVTVRAADTLTLDITGPESAGLTAGPDNLVLRAAGCLAPGQGAAIRLEKHLPQASGIGGGSADAAASLRVLARLWHQPLPDPARVLALGADVPVCLASRACRMQGVGEVLTPAPTLPRVWAVLANPRVAVPTPQVFRALDRRDHPPMADLPAWPDAAALARWLATQRNDLEAAAIRVAPAIAPLLADLAALPGALLARMSGSGATCFALFADPTRADAAATLLRRARPAAWVCATRLGDAPPVPDPA